MNPTTDPIKEGMPATPETSQSPDTSDIGAYTAGLQTSGDFDFADSTGHKARISLSAPILPRTDVIYRAENRVPSDPVAEAALGHDASLTYDWLLTRCAPLYPGIKLPTAGRALTPAERSTNYNLVALCSYEKFTAKPYWIPKLVNDVDLCKNELGTGYSLPTEADLAGLSDADYRFLSEQLTTAAGTSEFWGNYYFSLLIYLRGADGTLKMADLSVGAAPRVKALPVSPDSQAHLENAGKPLSLRCLRRAPTP